MALDTAFPLGTRVQHCWLLCCPTYVFKRGAVSNWAIQPEKVDFGCWRNYFSSLDQSHINHLFLQGNGTSHHYGIPSVTGVESKQGLKHDFIFLNKSIYCVNSAVLQGHSYVNQKQKCP